MGLSADTFSLGFCTSVYCPTAVLQETTENDQNQNIIWPLYVLVLAIKKKTLDFFSPEESEVVEERS